MLVVDAETKDRDERRVTGSIGEVDVSRATAEIARRALQEAMDALRWGNGGTSRVGLLKSPRHAAPDASQGEEAL
jgi:hypothetical protein